MGWNFLSTVEGLEIVFVILIVLVVIIVILDMIENKFRELYNLHKNSRNNLYKRKLKKLKYSKQDPEKIFDSISLLARDFFKEAFNISKNIEYSELIDLFREKRNKEGVTFSRMMVALSYSGEKVDANKNRTLINILEKIIRRHKIFSEKERSEIEREIKKVEKKEVREEKIQKDIKKYRRVFNLKKLFQINPKESKIKEVKEHRKVRIKRRKTKLKKKI